MYIVGAARTAIGNFSGAFSSLSAAELGGAAVREALGRAAVKAEQVDDVIMGQVLTAGTASNLGVIACKKQPVLRERRCPY